MAHIYQSRSGVVVGSTNPLTSTLTVPSGCTLLVVVLGVVGAVNRAGGSPTFNSVAMVQAASTAKYASSPEGSCEIWYMLGPPIGVYNLSVPNTGALRILSEGVYIAAGGGRTTALRTANIATGLSVDPAGPVLSCSAGDAVIAGIFTGADDWVPTGYTGTLIGNYDDGLVGIGKQFSVPVADGNVTLGWTFAVSDDWAVVAAAFMESGTALPRKRRILGNLLG
jgi:hypothetical protein